MTTDEGNVLNCNKKIMLQCTKFQLFAKTCPGHISPQKCFKKHTQNLASF